MPTDLDHYRTQCTFKIAYSSRAQARIAARKASDTGGPSMDPYYCPFCNNFHLTSLPKAAQKRARKAIREYLALTE